MHGAKYLNIAKTNRFVYYTVMKDIIYIVLLSLIVLLLIFLILVSGEHVVWCLFN